MLPDNLQQCVESAISRSEIVRSEGSVFPYVYEVYDFNSV